MEHAVMQYAIYNLFHTMQQSSTKSLAHFYFHQAGRKHRMFESVLMIMLRQDGGGDFF